MFGLFTLISNSHGIYLEVDRTGVWKIPEDTLHNLTVSLRFNISSEYDTGVSNLPAEYIPASEPKLVVRVQADEDWKLDFVNPVVEFSPEDVYEETNKSITFSGYYWGLSKLRFFLTRNDLDPTFQNETILRDDLMVVIDRKVLVLDTVFITFCLVFMLVNNVMMGSQLDLRIIISVLKKPLGPLCGFISQFTIMPVVTFFFGKMFFSDPLMRLGLFTLGCCPGGIMSNFWTLMFDGDINLSITMTAVSTLAAMGMMPLWLFTLGKSLLDENDNLQIPYSNLAVSLIGLTIPVSIGMIVKYKKPDWGVKVQRIIKPFTLIVILFFMILGTYNSYKVFLLLTWPMVIAGFFVAICGYAFGATLAKLFCLSRDQVIAISIETAMQNAAVGFLLLKLSLPSPNGDLAALPIMATMLLTGPPVIIIYGIYVTSQRYCARCRSQKDNAPDDQKDKADLAIKEERDMFVDTDKDNFLADKDKTIQENHVKEKFILEGNNDLDKDYFPGVIDTKDNIDHEIKLYPKLPLYQHSETQNEVGESDIDDYVKANNVLILEGFTKQSVKRKMSLSEVEEL
ncbi:hypothetical protein SK128_011282 [Halocaridina rubra]|uniref:Uncharacterized protein n=1 Tax=Halocaridina rubra TaxID=373956 RepID=A0AAN8WLC7_HALRR